MADPLPLNLDLTAGDPAEDLPLQPGTVRLYKTTRLDGSITRDADIRCPGCGVGIAHLDSERYPLVGDEFGLGCLTKITMALCCGGSWWLRGGMWVSEESQP